MEGGGKVRGMKELLAAIDEGGERGLDLSDSVWQEQDIQKFGANFKLSNFSNVIIDFQTFSYSGGAYRGAAVGAGGRVSVRGGSEDVGGAAKGRFM